MPFNPKVPGSRPGRPTSTRNALTAVLSSANGGGFAAQYAPSIHTFGTAVDLVDKTTTEPSAVSPAASEMSILTRVLDLSNLQQAHLQAHLHRNTTRRYRRLHIQL